MKNYIKKVIAGIIAVSAVALGGISASATTAQDVVSAARSAGIMDTYVTQLENFLRVNKFSSDEYDVMINGLGNIRNISMDVVHQFFPDVQSIDEFFGSGSSTPDLSKDEQTISDLAQDISDKMSHEQMLDAINEVISTGKQLGLDVSVEQLGNKSFTLTVKDSDGNVKLVAPIGTLVSTTGVEAENSENDFLTVAAVCASIITAGAAGAWVLSRVNKVEE